MQGRFCLIWGRLASHDVTIANYYGPNVDDPQTPSVLWSKIQALGSTYLVWGGDFNMTMCPQMDRSQATAPHYTASHKLLADLVTTNYSAPNTKRRGTLFRSTFYMV